LKGLKSNGAFANFCYSFYRDDFYIFIPVRSLKVRSNKPNALKGVIPKLGLHKSKDCHRSIVSKEIIIENNGFRDPNSWESIERGLHMPEDRPYELVES